MRNELILNTTDFHCQLQDFDVQGMPPHVKKPHENIQSFSKTNRPVMIFTVAKGYLFLIFYDKSGKCILKSKKIINEI